MEEKYLEIVKKLKQDTPQQVQREIKQSKSRDEIIKELESKISVIDKQVIPFFLDLAQKIIEAGKKYDLVISEGKSAKVVSLFCKKIVDTIQEKYEIPKVEIKFIALNENNTDNESCNEIRRKIGDTNYERALLSTEYIGSGKHIKMYIEILQELNVPFDIASFSIEDFSIYNLSLSLKGDDTNIFYGEFGSTGLSIFYREKIDLETVEQDINILTEEIVKWLEN